MGIFDSLFGGGLSTIFGSTANSVQPNVNADAGSGGMQTSLTPAATTPTPSPQPGTGPAVQPAMSDQDALKMIPDTINLGELASLQMKNASSDPASYVQKLNDDYWTKKYDFGQMPIGQTGTAQAQGAQDQNTKAPATKTISPGLLGKMDQEMNPEWWK